MSKKHDEGQDVRSLKKRMLVDETHKTIQASKDTIIGNKLWGKIDFLTKYCKYVFIWNNTVKIDKSSTDNPNNKKKLKQVKQAAKNIKPKKK